MAELCPRWHPSPGTDIARRDVSGALPMNLAQAMNGWDAQAGLSGPDSGTDCGFLVMGPGVDPGGREPPLGIRGIVQLRILSFRPPAYNISQSAGFVKG